MRVAVQNLNKIVRIHPNRPATTATDYLFSSSIRDDVHLGDHVSPMPYSSRFSWMRGILAFHSTTESLYFGKWEPDGEGAIGVAFSGTADNPSITDPFTLAAEQPVLKAGHNKACDKVLAYVDDCVPSWDSLTDAAEAHQLYSMVEDVSQRFRNIFEGVIHRNPRQILRGFGIKPTVKKRRAVRKKLYLYTKKTTYWSVDDAVGDLYLTYRYGITPVLHSLDDAIDAFGKALWVPDVHLPVKEGAKVECAADVISFTRDGTVQADVVTSRSCLGFLTYRGSLSFRDSIMERIRGSIPIRAARTAWELVPWSFVADWFISIGDWLSKLSVSEIVSRSVDLFCSAYLTVTEKKFFRNINPSTEFGWLRFLKFTSFGTELKGNVTTFRRFPVDIHVPPPRFKIGFSSSAFTHAIDSLFLLLGVARRARKQSYIRPSSY